ncbi:MAG: hypothetical protein EOO00_06155 [Chitinophagaceae bacterium]|nr:MAG: hypothetical protein EOO00_06155 [Chitinophagaceae bacterium]
MAKAPLKRIAIPIEDLIDKIDLSALAIGEKEEFRVWMTQSINMQTTVETALRRGHLVKACSIPPRKQIDYSVQIVNPDN